MSSLQQPDPRGESKIKVLYRRLLSTVILLSLLCSAVVWNHELGYYGLISALCVLTAWEWRHMLLSAAKPAYRGVATVAGMVYPCVLSVVCYFTKSGCCCCYEAHVHLPVLLPVGMMILAPVMVMMIAFILAMQQPIVGTRSLRAVGNTVLAFLYPGWLFTFSIPALHFAYSDAGAQNQEIVYLVLWLILVTKMCDIFAYVSGLLLGGSFFRRKLIPHISPKKTWEGILGSWLLTNLAAWGLMMWLLPCTEISYGFVFGFVGCVSVIFVLSVYGDLAGSLIKRSLAIKDSGSLLPGIGGIFDLIDSPAFTVPLLWFVLALSA